MANETARNAVAAAIIFAVFALGAYFMPAIMLTLGDISPVLAGIFAIGFLLAFYVLFWLRGGRKNETEHVRRNPLFVALLVVTGGFVLLLPWFFSPLAAISPWLAWGLVVVCVLVFFGALWNSGDQTRENGG